MPRFEQIFKDFRTPLPRLTRIMMHSTEWPLFILACLAGAAFAWFVLSQLASMIWPSPRPLFRGITDRLTWCLPLLGQMARNRGLADVFGIAGQATRDGYPLDRALAQAATLDLNLTLAGRVQRWQRAVESGTPLSQAAKQAGMPALAVGMLSTAQVAGQAGEVFGFLTTYYAQRFSRAAILLRAAVVPLLALFFGILVALICVSILMPMVSLVNNMPVFPRIR